MPIDPSCGHEAGACLCADLDKMPVSAIEVYLERRRVKDRQIEAVRRQVEQDKALREPPTATVEPGSVARTKWRPTVGARVMTTPFILRMPAAGEGEIVAACGERDFVVEFPDGSRGHYDADELAPAPEVRP